MRLQRVSTATCYGASSGVQDKDAEADSDGACAVANCYKVDNQDSGPEASLETVHGQEGARLELISKEEKNGEHINQQHNDHEENEEDGGAACC